METRDRLARLVGDLSDTLLGLPLPPGSLRSETYDGPWHEPLLWCSDEPVDVALWARLLSVRDEVGLHPVLLYSDRDRRDDGFWTRYLFPDLVSHPARHVDNEVLAEWWASATDHDPFANEEAEAEHRAVLEPFGDAWPGPAPAIPLRADPDRRAVEVAASLLDEGWLTEPHLALVPVDLGADIPAAIGWGGPMNHENDAGLVSAVLRSWEERFGARVVALSSDRLDLSVAAPARTGEQALAVAAEHLALCPDNVWQGSDTVRRYAEECVRDRPHWTFWWD